MAKKTPPLVIPVVVDTSGVDGNLQNLNQRLRRGGGGGVGGGGGIGGTGAGGFGSGGNNSLLSSAVAGAAAGRASRRGFNKALTYTSGRDPQIAAMGYEERLSYARQSMMGRIYQRMANFAANREASYARDNAALNRGRARYGQSTWNAADHAAADAATARNQLNKEYWNKKRDAWNIASTTATTNMYKRMAARSDMLANAPKTIPKMIKGLAANPLISGPIALGTAAIGYNAALMSNEFEGFKGSTNFGLMRAAQLAQFQAQRGKGGIMENFLLGGEQGYLGGTVGGGQLRSIGNIASFVANAGARGAGRMLARPITGTSENVMRLVSWSAGAIADIGNYLNFSLGGGATSADARYRDKVQAYIGLN